MSAAVGDYALGHSDAEMRRLATQSRLIDPITRRFLISAGVTRGMRVLDREFHGAADDWTPAAPCRAYIARLKAVGADAQMTEYPGALHAFDSVGSPAFFTDPASQTSRNCVRAEDNSVLINTATGGAFSYSDACVEFGPTMQYNDIAASAAQKAVKTILDDVFKQP